MDGPAAVVPDVEHPHAVGSYTGESGVAELRSGPPGDRVLTSASIAARADETERAAPASLQCPGQEALDLGSVSS
jgi:hypothetical protein